MHTGTHSNTYLHMYLHAPNVHVAAVNTQGRTESNALFVIVLSGIETGKTAHVHLYVYCMLLYVYCMQPLNCVFH